MNAQKGNRWPVRELTLTPAEFTRVTDLAWGMGLDELGPVSTAVVDELLVFTFHADAPDARIVVWADERCDVDGALRLLRIAPSEVRRLPLDASRNLYMSAAETKRADYWEAQANEKRALLDLLDEHLSKAGVPEYDDNGRPLAIGLRLALLVDRVALLEGELRELASPQHLRDLGIDAE